MIKKPLGIITTGSLTDGFVMRINHAAFDHIKTGKFVCITSSGSKFFSMITNIKLEVIHPDIMIFPPDSQDNLLATFLHDHHVYATASLKPLLMITANNERMPVKTVPTHFAPVHEADQQDITSIFGNEDHNNRYFSIGYPLDMQIPICLDLEKFVERSNAIFGKTGTGKTFLTRLILAGTIKNTKAVNLIFDMHSEYGLQARKEDRHQSFVKGLKTLFPDKVIICSLDPLSTRRRGGMPDLILHISYQSINVDDILSLQEELNLHPTACEAAYLIAARYHNQWLTVLLNHTALKDLAHEVGAHPESVAALYRKLKPIERFPFFSNEAHGNVIDQLLEYIDKGISIVIEFGNYTSTLCYLLIANIITRSIHAAYMQKTEKFLGSQSRADEPKKLMITIEEAHKFLNPSAARQTIFGTIAREMRKYYVSLLVVDQRPSGIDTEILSQIGTKIIAQLNDEKDIQSALIGMHDAQHLRTILATLDSKKQVLLTGHALPMPVVIQTRSYDDDFYRAMQGYNEKNLAEFAKELF